MPKSTPFRESFAKQGAFPEWSFFSSSQTKKGFLTRAHPFANVTPQRETREGVSSYLYLYTAVQETLSLARARPSIQPRVTCALGAATIVAKPWLYHTQHTVTTHSATSNDSAEM